jgi:hypothetical protein
MSPVGPVRRAGRMRSLSELLESCFGQQFIEQGNLNFLNSYACIKIKYLYAKKNLFQFILDSNVPESLFFQMSCRTETIVFILTNLYNSHNRCHSAA